MTPLQSSILKIFVFLKNIWFIVWPWLCTLYSKKHRHDSYSNMIILCWAHEKVSFLKKNNFYLSTDYSADLLLFDNNAKKNTRMAGRIQFHFLDLWEAPQLCKFEIVSANGHKKGIKIHSINRYFLWLLLVGFGISCWLAHWRIEVDIITFLITSWCKWPLVYTSTVFFAG